MKTPEGYEKDEIKKYLDTLPNCWYFCPMTHGFGKSGVPDIVACINGRFWGLEVKRPGKEPTAIQERRMLEICKARGKAFAGTAAVVIKYIRDYPHDD